MVEKLNNNKEIILIREGVNSMNSQNADRLSFDNGSYYIGNYVALLLKNNLIKKGKIIDIKPDDNYIIIRIYKSRLEHSDIKITKDEIKGIKLAKWEYPIDIDK
jgi:hypothetical protein